MIDARPWGWVAADVSGMGSDSGALVDVWHFFTQRERPPLDLKKQLKY